MSLSVPSMFYVELKCEFNGMCYVEVKYEFYGMCYLEVKYEPYSMFKVEVKYDLYTTFYVRIKGTGTKPTVWNFTSLLVVYTNVTVTRRNFHAGVPVRGLQ